MWAWSPCRWIQRTAIHCSGDFTDIVPINPSLSLGLSVDSTCLESVLINLHKLFFAADHHNPRELPPCSSGRPSFLPSRKAMTADVCQKAPSFAQLLPASALSLSLRVCMICKSLATRLSVGRGNRFERDDEMKRNCKLDVIVHGSVLHACG